MLRNLPIVEGPATCFCTLVFVTFQPDAMFCSHSLGVIGSLCFFFMFHQGLFLEISVTLFANVWGSVSSCIGIAIAETEAQNNQGQISFALWLFMKLCALWVTIEWIEYSGVAN